MPSPTAIVLAALVASRVGLVSFQRVPIPDDVPAHLCSAIAQDRQGLLWFGTQRAWWIAPTPRCTPPNAVAATRASAPTHAWPERSAAFQPAGPL